MILGKNNNNAGMHYVNYSHYGAGDDLGYYNKNSDEYRMNQYYEAKSQLEEMGQYDFVTNSGFIKVKNEKVDFEDWSIYFVYTYSNEHMKKLQHVSTRYTLYDLQMAVVIDDIFVHDKQRVIYIEKQECIKIDKERIYRIKQK